ncbi:MAG: cytosolic leucyl tRNA synthetase [Bathelium mastoideum]|nr:MAG: cytosolic leucyl tRNA synthetase [Bathelium mastoideum]
MAATQATAEALNPNNAEKGTLKIENTDKRDTLIASEKIYQQKWQQERVFETDAPSTKEVPFGAISAEELWSRYPRFFGAMAYPYMNGTLHMGHSFTASKVEFQTGVARMQGKRALFPQGYHCTGMPIKACADKLVREIELFGRNFEDCPTEEITNGEKDEQVPAPTQSTTKEDVTKFTAKKGKAAAKSVKMKYQFQIMLAIGIPVDQIHKFADPQYWLEFFPPLCKRDMTALGCRIDWRRQMVTTDANPYYDAFVRWQMNRLYELGKIKFGKRYTVYSPKDGQACMDHDRQSGEGLGVQEYTALKLKVKEWPEKAQKKLSGKLPSNANVYFVPATLRPETMYGQTCCFVGPKVTYGIFKVSESEYFFVSPRAARNMAFQSLFPEWGVFPQVAELEGSEVVGTLVTAPLSVHGEVRVLPMETVKPTKGTGVVTCVPSDSPDDYATIMDLIKKSDYYGIQKEWAELEILPIIETPSYGNLSAKFLVEKMKINSPKDAMQLAEAKDLAYKEGYYQGKMCYGDFKSKSVEEAKPLVRQQLIDASDAFNYAEPEGLVISRSGDECVAGHLDQWFMNYGSQGDPAWQQQVLDHIDQDLQLYSTEAKNAFEQTIDWLGQWAATRSYGLGSRFPIDKQWLVESLSDSTIYHSYYTIAHLLHMDYFGVHKGSANVSPEQMTDEVWDYVFTRRDEIESDIPLETLQSMRREFEYFYPIDVNISGKDLVNNHLTFFLYIHLALFPKSFWPRGIRINGHLQLNGEKMSKSTGNFLTLSDAVSKFGADATRVALADAGDGMEDANFEETVADTTILRLFELRKWCEEIVLEARLVSSSEEYVHARDNERLKNSDVIQRTGPKLFWDELFENELNGLVKETIQNYEGSMYKSALKSGFYDFTSARDFYRSSCRAAEIGMHQAFTRRYIELQALLLTPIAPHWAEYVWLEVLKKPTTVQYATFPQVFDPRPSLTAARDYIRTISGAITSAEGTQTKRQAKGKLTQFDPRQPKAVTIYCASSFPRWQDTCIGLLRDAFDALALSVDMKKLSQDVGKAIGKGPEAKKAMPFVQGLKKRLEGGEQPEKVFGRKLGFEEVQVLREMVPGLRQTVMRCKRVEVVMVKEGGKKGEVVAGSGEGVLVGRQVEELQPVAEGAVPGGPTFYFENI